MTLFAFSLDIEADTLEEARKMVNTMRDAVNLDRDQRTWAHFEYIGQPA